MNGEFSLVAKFLRPVVQKRMDVSTLRIIDRWIGTALTLILTAARKLTGWWRADASGPIRKILFVKLAEQGSTVLAYGAIVRAVKMAGKQNVYFLVFEENRFILDAMAVIPERNVIVIKTGSFPSMFVSIIAAVRRMRALRLDAAIDMEFFARASAVFTYLSGAGRRVGFHAYAGDGPYRGDLMTHRLVYNPHIHTSQVFETMVEALKHPAKSFPAFPVQAPPLVDVEGPEFWPDEVEIKTVRDMLKEITGEDHVPPIILLNANCSDLLPLRRWESNNYVELTRRLLDRYEQLYVAFTGAPVERGPVEQLVCQVGSNRCVSLAGRTTLRQLLTVYSECQLLVTNDSGPAHFATLTPIEIITLFGPETPKLFAAPSERSHVIWAGTVCSPCVNAYNNRQLTCKNNVCMQLISVDEVFEKACEVFERRIQAYRNEIKAAI